MPSFWARVAQPEEVQAVGRVQPIDTKYLVRISRPRQQAFYSFEVSELVPDFSGKDKTLTCKLITSVKR